MPQGTTEVPRVSAGGLVTVAFLKARLDEGSDHLGIFMPLVSDVLVCLPGQSFATTDVQEALAATHGVAMPQDTVATLLRRATRKRYLLREAGRFRRNPDQPFPATNVAVAKKEIEEGQQRLGGALQKHAARRGLALQSADAALDMLFKFLEEEQVGLLLANPRGAADGGGADQRERAILGEFLRDAISDDTALQSVIRGMLEGLVLYHAAFLPDLAGVNRRFDGLRVVFDSVLVRQALGYEGVGMRTLMRETVDLLKGSGVQCLVFDQTVHEIKRILAMYEEKLATDAGRSSLRPVPMARHFLTQRYAPSDVREMSALLEREIVAAGFQKQQTPRRVERLTLGEEALAKRLADPIKKDPLEPRVMHDVDCVAGVLTLRNGHRSQTVEDARVVFATSAPLVIRNTRLWWEEDERETGIAPMVHIRALANLAWLKRPSLCSDFKMRELVSLCTAALRPAQETWRRFLRHLESLKASQKLTSDEVAAIVISAMSDRLLSEAEMEEDDPNDIDAVTLDDIVERVRATYGARADEQVHRVTEEYERRISETEAQAKAVVAEAGTQAQEAMSRAETAERTAAEALRRVELAMEGRAQKWASWICRVLQWLAAAILVAGAAALILGHPLHGGTLGVVVGVLVVVFVALELVGILRHVSEWRSAFELRLRMRFRNWLSGDPQSKKPPPADQNQAGVERRG